MPGVFNLTGHGANVVGSLGSGSLVQDMPTVWSNQYPFADETSKYGSRANETEWNLTDAITVEFWVRKSFTTDFQDATIFHKQGTFSVALNAGGQYGYKFNFRPTIGASQKVIEVDDKYIANQEESVHFCATYDGTTVKLYINGSLVKEDGSTASGDMDTTANPLYFPKGGGSYAIQGNLWDGRLWNRVLDQSEIQTNFNNKPTTTGGLVSDTGLVGWWPLLGNYNDISGLGFNLTDGGDTEWGSSGFNLKQIASGSVSGSATVSGGTWNLRDSSYASFNGSSDYINIVPAGTDLDQPKSMAFWCKFDSVHTAQFISRGSNDYEVYIHSSDNWGAYWGTRYVDMAYTDVPSPSDYLGEWTHVVVTLDDSTSPPTQRFYINGVLEDTSTLSGAPAYGDDSDFEIGRRTGGTQNLDGDIYDVRLIGYPMNQYEVAALYAGRADPPAMGKWLGVGKANRYTQVTDSTTVIDMGNQKNDGTMSSNLWVNPTYKFHSTNAYASTAMFVRDGTAIQAPRGVFEWDPVNSLTYIHWDGGTWYHNSGTWHTAGTSNYNCFQCGTGAVKGGLLSGATFYNLSSSATQWFGYASQETHVNTYWVENNWYLGNAESGFRGARPYGSAVIFGTDTTSGTLTTGAGARLRTLDGGADKVSLEGKSELFPAVIDTTWQTSEGSNIIEVKNVDWITSEPFGSNASPIGSSDAGITMKLTGPAKFTELTQSDSVGLTVFDFNGERLECNRFRGGWDAPSYTLADVKGSLLVLTGSPPEEASAYVYQIGYGGGSVDVTELSMLCNSTITTGTSVHWNSSAPIKNFFSNVLPGDESTGQFGQTGNDRSAAEKFIIGNGAYRGYAGVPGWAGRSTETAKFMIADGGLYYPNSTDDVVKITPSNSQWNRTDSGWWIGGGMIGKGNYAGDGVNNNYVDIWNSDISDFEFGTGPLTIEAWVRGTSAGGLLGSYWGSDLPMYQLDVGDGTATNMRVLATGAGGASTDGLTTVNANATTNVIDGKWHHVVGVRDTTAGLVKLYIDGKLENESSDAATVAEGGNVDNGQRKKVGARGSYGELDGDIARASFWKSALTAAEIREMLLYDWADTTGSAIDHTKCVAWYEFSDLQTGTNVTDMTGSGNTGTLTSTSLWGADGTMDIGSMAPTVHFAGIAGETSYIKAFSAPTFGDVNLSGGANTIIDCTPYLAVNVNDTLTMGSGTLYGDTTSGSTYTNLRFRNTGTSEDYAVCLIDGIHRGAGPDANVPDGLAHIWGGGTTWYGNYMQVPAGTYAGMNTYGSVKQVGDIISYRAKPTATYENDNIGALSYYGRWDTNGYDILSCEGLKSNETGSQWTFGAGTSVYFRQYGTDATWGFNKAQGATGQYNMNGEAALQIRADEQPESGCLTIAGPPVLVTGNSVSMWVNPKNFDNNYGFFGYGSNHSFMNMRSGTEQSRMFGEAKPNAENPDDYIYLDAGETVFTAGTWTHVGWIWNTDRTWDLYIDGVLKDDGTWATSASGTNELTLGYFGRGYGETTDWDGSIADCRIFRSVLTSGNMATLAAINPATDVSGNYPDPDNDLDAAGWWKLGADAVGAADLTNYGTSGATWAGSTDGAKKSGFVRFLKADPTDVDNYPFEHDANYATNAAAGTVTLTNTYVSGSQDIVLEDGNVLHTKGTVVLD